MKKVFGIILSILLLGCVAAEKEPVTFESPDHEQIHNLFQKLADTITARDKEGLLSLSSDKSTISTQDQNRKEILVTKQEYADMLSSWKLKRWKKLGLKCKLLDVKDISIDGDNAKATGIIKMSGYDWSRNFTLKRVLLKENGQWVFLKPQD